MENFQSVFECHPLVDEIFVVDGMPFLEPGHAQSHSVNTGKPVERVKRSSEAPEKPKAAAPGKSKADSSEKPEFDAPAAEAGDDPPAEHVQTSKKGRGKKG